MTSPTSYLSNAETGELLSVLSAGLTKFFGHPRPIRGLDRRLSEYHTSFAIERWQVDFENGDHLTVIFKNLSPTALLASAQNTRHASFYRPAREILVYQGTLHSLQLGTAIPYAASIDASSDRYWLILEKVEGIELYQVGAIEVWQEVARWLAQFHSRAAAMVSSAADQQLHDWNCREYGQLIERARENVRLRLDGERERIAAFERVAETFDWAATQLMAQPQTVIHGDFFASNILVQSTEQAIRVCPIDWETAAVGPGVIDLAALIAGNWTERQRSDLASAYWRALSESGSAMLSTQRPFDVALTCGRLFLAVQLLARPASWEPPVEHRCDWLGEALEMTAWLRSFGGFCSHGVQGDAG